VLPLGSDYKFKRHLTHDEQPFRRVIDAIVKTFFRIDSLEELSVDTSITKYIVYCASDTTHPAVFEAAYRQTCIFLVNANFKLFIHHILHNTRYHWVVGELTFGCVCLALTFMMLMHLSRPNPASYFCIRLLFYFMFACRPYWYLCFALFAQKKASARLSL
jgi:hypothetical protein